MLDPSCSGAIAALETLASVLGAGDRIDELTSALEHLEASGAIVRTASGWSLASPEHERWSLARDRAEVTPQDTSDLVKASLRQRHQPRPFGPGAKRALTDSVTR